MQESKITNHLPLKGPRIELTALEKDDIAALSYFFQDMAALSFYIPTTARPLNLQQITQLLSDWNDGDTFFVFAVRRNHKLIGLVNLDGLDWANGHVEVGIALTDYNARGQGLAGEALSVLFDYCFLELGLHRVWARIIDGNEPSLHLFNSLGFRQEGALREHVRRTGSFRDMIIVGLLASEWQARSD